MGFGCLGAGGVRRTGAGRKDVRGKKPSEAELVTTGLVLTTSPRSDLGSAGGLPITRTGGWFTTPAVSGSSSVA